MTTQIQILSKSRHSKKLRLERTIIVISFSMPCNTAYSITHKWLHQTVWEILNWWKRRLQKELWSKWRYWTEREMKLLWGGRSGTPQVVFLKDKPYSAFQLILLLATVAISSLCTYTFQVLFSSTTIQYETRNHHKRPRRYHDSSPDLSGRENSGSFASCCISNVNL